jgi:hypothetical protein
MTTVTYKNAATGERYELGIELLENETPLEAAWGRGFKTAKMIKRWNKIDIQIETVN